MRGSQFNELEGLFLVKAIQSPMLDRYVVLIVQIIDSSDIEPLLDQKVSNFGSDKPSNASDQYLSHVINSTFKTGSL